MDQLLNQRKIFDPAGNDSIEARQLLGGNPTGIANLNSVKYKWSSSLYKIMINNFWIPEKVSLVDDRVTIKELTPDEMSALKNTLSFLIALDSMQTANAPKLGDYITAPEVQSLFTIQAFQELIHSQSYQYMLQELFPNLEREEIYNYWRTNPLLLERNKFIADQYNKFNENKTLENFKISLAADLALEGIYFYNGFNFFYQLAARNKIANTAKLVRYIENDEKCLTADTEVMTVNGWKTIDAVTVLDTVYEYDINSKQCSFVKPTAIIKNKTDVLYDFSGPEFSQTVTGPHRMIIENSEGQIIAVAASDIADVKQDFSYIISGNKSGSVKKLTPQHIDLIKQSKNGEIELFDWIGPIINDIDSTWVVEFLDKWTNS